jgi:molybdenum cofactor guanylyltransferase
MGTPKHLLKLGDRTFLECCLGALEGVVEHVIVSIGAGHETPALDSAIQIIEDRQPDNGPLSGLASTLQSLDAEHIAVISCDAPLIKPGVLSLLFDAIGTHDAALYNADGRTQHFPGVYDRKVGGIAHRLLESGEHRMSALVGACRCFIVSENQVRSLDPALESFLNVNTPDEYRSLVRRYKGG